MDGWLIRSWHYTFRIKIAHPFNEISQVISRLHNIPSGLFRFIRAFTGSEPVVARIVLNAGP